MIRNVIINNVTMMIVDCKKYCYQRCYKELLGNKTSDNASQNNVNADENLILHC